MVIKKSLTNSHLTIIIIKHDMMKVVRIKINLLQTVKSWLHLFSTYDIREKLSRWMLQGRRPCWHVILICSLSSVSEVSHCLLPFQQPKAASPWDEERKDIEAWKFCCRLLSSSPCWTAQLPQDRRLLMRKHFYFTHSWADIYSMYSQIILVNIRF